MLALRPFSLVVALATCSLGISLALRDGEVSLVLACLVLLAGIFLQAGVNLINDHADLPRGKFSVAEQEQVTHNARVGALAILIATLIGVVFVVLRGVPMLLLGATGVFGAWSYAAGPINFKNRGLGFIAVFFLTGVMMVAGTYYALTGTLRGDVLLLSLPFSLFASLLLLANELRDYESDLEEGQQTFSVRFGRRRGVFMYRLFVALLFFSTAWLVWTLEAPRLGISLMALILLLWPLRLLNRPVMERVTLAQQTGRCYFVFAALFVGMSWIAEL